MLRYPVNENKYTLFNSIISFGTTDLFREAYQKGYKWLDEDVIPSIVKYDRLDVLTYVIKNNLFSFNHKRDLEHLVKFDKLDMIKMVYSYHCTVYSYFEVKYKFSEICELSIKYDNLDILKWTKYSNFEWDQKLLNKTDEYKNYRTHTFLMDNIDYFVISPSKTSSFIPLSSDGLSFQPPVNNSPQEDYWTIRRHIPIPTTPINNQYYHGLDVHHSQRNIMNQVQNAQNSFRYHF